MRLLSSLFTLVLFATLMHAERASAQDGFDPRTFICFYECKEGPAVRGDETWQEVTTLMVSNPTGIREKSALIFFDGNQQAIASVVDLGLPGFDLDEVNVCRTLRKAEFFTPNGNPPVPVPSAGQILVLSTGPIYVWMKNILGKFFKNVDEPFDGRVSAIAKVDCHAVPASALSTTQIAVPAEVRLVPVCVEQTADNGGTDCGIGEPN